MHCASLPSNFAFYVSSGDRLNSSYATATVSRSISGFPYGQPFIRSLRKFSNDSWKIRLVWSCIPRPGTMCRMYVVWLSAYCRAYDDCFRICKTISPVFPRPGFRCQRIKIVEGACLSRYAVCYRFAFPRGINVAQVQQFLRTRGSRMYTCCV